MCKYFHFSILIIVAVFLSSTVKALDHRNGEIPMIIGSPGEGAANTWVAADNALDQQGNLRPDVVGPEGVSILASYRATRVRAGSGTTTAQMAPPAAALADPCGGVTMSLPSAEQYRPNSTVDEILAESVDVISGRIVAMREGFYRGVPASLIKVAILENHRQSGTVKQVDGSVFLVYPYATLRVAGVTYCTRPRQPLPYPVVGDRLIIFNYLPGQAIDHSIIEVPVERQLVIEHQGILTLPANLENFRSYGDFDALSRRLSHVLNGNEPKLWERGKHAH
jgi:hypothetical protein